MAQHDYVISNGTGAAVRSDLNNALLAIVSQNSGATEPTTTYAYQWWADTTTGLLKIRNSANNAWITLRELDGTLTIEDGTVSAPGLVFRDDLNTGIWRPGTDQFAISTNGVERVEWGTSEVVFNDGGTNYDFRVEGDNNANLLFVDASADAVGIGTSSPSTNTEINAALDTGASLALNEGQLSIGREANSGGAVRIGYDTTNNFGFISSGRVGVSWDKLILNAGGGNVGIGTASPDVKLHVAMGNGTGYIKLDGGTSSQATTGILFRSDTNNYQSEISSYQGNLQFITGANERARIDSSGRLLVGTSSASNTFTTALLQGNAADTTGDGVLRLARGAATPASGNGLGYIVFSDSGHVDAAYIFAARDGGTWSGSSKPTRLVFSTTADGSSSPTERMRIASTGRITIEANGSTGGLYVNNWSTGAGNSTVKYNSSTGQLTYDTSSRLVKDNIQDCPYGIKELKLLQPRKYFRTDDQRTEIGFIADELVGVMPEFVPVGAKSIITRNEEDIEDVPLAVNYEKLTAVLTKALQEAVTRIEQLESTVATLQAP